MDKVLIWINTYNRPEKLDSLLADILQQKGNIIITTLIYNDHSTREFCSKYSKVIKSYSSKMKIIYYYTRRNHGKRQYWKLYNIAIDRMHHLPIFDYYFHLDDDLHLLYNDSLQKLINYWKLITDDTKICFMPFKDERILRNQWNDIKPEIIKYGDTDFYRIGWIDDIFFCQQDLFKLFHPIPRINPRRWKNNPNLSTGTGRYITQRIKENKLHIYALPLDKALITHDFSQETNPSVMNRNNIKNKNTPRIID